MNDAEENLYPTIFDVHDSIIIFSAEHTTGMVWGLMPLKHDGNKALWDYGTMAIRCKL